MLKHASTLFLIAAAVLVGVFFFRILQPFVLPLILAGVGAVLLWPVQQRMTRICCGHSRVAAFVTTFSIVLVVLIPVAAGLVLAASQMARAASDLVADGDIQEVLPEVVADPDAATTATATATQAWWPQLQSWFSRQQFEYMQEMVGRAVQDATQDIYRRTVGVVANVIAFVIGLAVFLLALYYFLAENEHLLRELQRLSPLENADDEALWHRFVRACRGMLLGTLLAAALQALLNGIGFAVAGVPGALILAFCTFFLSVIPFLGAASVWVPVVVFLLFQERWMAAALMATYGTLVVSTVDNVIRAYALHGQASIHPLLALVSIMGAVQLFGLWGIIVGPVIAVLFHVLLELVKKKLAEASPPASTTASSAT